MIGKKKFEKLLEPGQIGRVKTRNRMIKTASSLGYQYDQWDGNITEKHIALCEAIARGGVGLLICEMGIFDWPLGAHDIFHYRSDDEKYLPGWVKLAEAIHKQGCPAFVQMFHAGPWHKTSMSGLQPVGASAGVRVEEGGNPDETRELTISEIKEIVVKYAKAAELYQKAGFDGIEINASGNHLLDSFLSRGFNKRLDAYGCESLENRSRIVVEIIQAIKGRLGKDFPISVLFAGAEYGLENGLTIEETKGFARIFQEAGADCLHIRAEGVGKYLSSHYPELVHYPEPPKPLGEWLDGSRHGAGGYVPLAAEIKKVVSIPVIAVGRLDPELGEDILRKGKADFIGMTKRILADPELPNKVASGRLEDIAPCTACEECISLRVTRFPVRCRINAALGTEDGYVIRPAEKKKKVLVVGGGPAGMEAARVAALRGHEVMLYEKENKLGGLLPLAALVKGTEGEDLIGFVQYFETQLTKLGVKMELGKEFNPALIAQIKPDAVILAVGGTPFIPDIPGIKGSNVVKNSELHHKLKLYLKIFGVKNLRGLTKSYMPVGKRVVIIGGAIQGAELAEFMVKRGRKVTIVAGDEPIAEGLARRKQWKLVEWLGEKGVAMITQAKCEEITDKGLTITTKEGKRQTIEADTVVPTLPFKPNTELFETLKGKVPEIYLIGDANEPRLIIYAIADGWRTANAI